MYFGKFPWYFSYFLHSCKYNSDVDFCIITDNKPPVINLPSNVRFVQKSIDKIEWLASKKLGFTVVINNPYKLCDFKSAYGFLFSELIEDYDFWGYSDIDIIYGNIRNFATEEVLTKYDIMSVRPEYISGFFCLHRNNFKINTLFKLSKDYKKVFTQKEYVGFEECAQLCFELMDGKSLSELDAPVESMTHVVKRLNEKKSIRALFEFYAIEGCPGELKWDKGALFYKNEFEILLYHLMWLKNNPALKIPSWSKIPDTFFINSNCFSKQEGCFNTV